MSSGDNKRISDGCVCLGAMTPLLLLPHEVFTHFPYALTLKGQYIIKNLVIVSATFVIGATARGGELIAEPHHIV